MSARRTRTIWFVVLLALAALAAAFVYWSRTREAPATLVAVEALTQGLFLREVSGSGVIEAVEQRALAWSGGGTVAFALEEGTAVRAGDTLARLDTGNLERDADTIRTALASALAERARLEAQQAVDRQELATNVRNAEDQRTVAERRLADATRERTTSERLYDVGAASLDQRNAARAAVADAERALEQAVRALESAQSRERNFSQLASAQLASSDAQLSNQRTQLANLESRIADATLTAPLDGVLVQMNARAGDLVGGGPIATVADLARLQVRARFDENRAAELRVGQTAALVPDADATRRLPATVERISPTAVREAGVAQVGVVLSLPEQDRASALTLVRPGYSVTVRVRVNEVPQALLMPLEAISEDSGGVFVMRARESDSQRVAERVPVLVVDRNPTVAAVESTPDFAGSPLRAGDLIIVVGVDSVKDGAAVRWTNVGGRVGE